MDSKQKSTEGIRLLLTEEFVDDLDFYQDDEVEFIIKSLSREQENFKVIDRFSQYVYGVIQIDEPVYFKIEFINEQDERPMYLSLTNVSVDDFLDAINNNQTLQLNETRGVNN
jgi:hypothetical protein